MIKEKLTISEQLKTLRLEYDALVSSMANPAASSDQTADVIRSQAKQLNDLSEELNSERNQLTESYSEMEAIFKVNQELESKNKLLSSKVEYSNKRIEMMMDEMFKKSRINETSKKEAMQIENSLKQKDEIIKKLEEEKKLLVDKIEVEQQNVFTIKQRESIKDEIINQYEVEITELKKKESELKHQVKEYDSAISTVFEELQERLFKVSVNYLKTGKIQDPKTISLEDGNIQELGEVGILMLELNKYKKMVKCPN